LVEDLFPIENEGFPRKNGGDIFSTQNNNGTENNISVTPAFVETK
jgi:hypothetical protein